MLLNTWGLLNSWKEPPAGGANPREVWRKRKELRKQLEGQYDKEIEQLVQNLTIETLSPVGEHIESPGAAKLNDVKAFNVDLPDIGAKVRDEVLRSVSEQRSRELLIRKVQRERALRKFEEELALVLVLIELSDEDFN